MQIHTNTDTYKYGYIQYGYIRELVKDFGVYVKFVDLEQAEQLSKGTLNGLMRALVCLWY